MQLPPKPPEFALPIPQGATLIPPGPLRLPPGLQPRKSPLDSSPPSPPSFLVSTITEATTQTPDWDLAKLLWLQRVPGKEIAAKCHVRYDTLKKRAARHQWGKLLANSVTYLQLRKKEQESVGEPLRDILKAKAAGQAASLPDKLPKSPRKAQQVAATTLSITSTAKMLEGWADGPTAHLDIHVLASKPVELGCEAIDIEEVPVIPSASPGQPTQDG